SFHVRRGAERALEAAGSAALDAAVSEEAAEGRVRLDALVRALEDRLADKSPTAAASAAKILRRLEVRATDDQVRLVPRLLRVRLRRLVAQTVVPKDSDLDGREADGSAS